MSVIHTSGKSFYESYNLTDRSKGPLKKIMTMVTCNLLPKTRTILHANDEDWQKLLGLKLTEQIKGSNSAKKGSKP